MLFTLWYTILYYIVIYSVFQVQKIGLSGAYLRREHDYTLVGQLLQLPMVPARDTHRVFERLREDVRGQKMERLFEYVERRWLHSRVWRPKDWSVYQMAVRTNNDCEGMCYLTFSLRAQTLNVTVYYRIWPGTGYTYLIILNYIACYCNAKNNYITLYMYCLCVTGWHKALNTCVKKKTPFYGLVAALHKEALYASIQVRLVSQQKLTRRQKRTYKELQGQTFTIWRRYQNGQWSLMRMVRRFATLYRPRVQQAQV